MPQFLNISKIGRSRSTASETSNADNLVEDVPDSSDFTTRRATSEPTGQLISPLLAHPQDSRSVLFTIDDPGQGPIAQSAGEPNDTEAVTSSIDPLGLTLHSNPSNPEVDIIFVHGLGGSSMRTWSFKRDPRNFWPLWLSAESELDNARIFTFGYNARILGSGTVLNITDFAKDLLLKMLTFVGPSGKNMSIRIGQHPIIFVVHSMGGLIVKKAYILGKHDREYRDIISQVRGMAFLATPHRGSNYAYVLNQILATLPFPVSQKEYISQLEAKSSTLQDINDQFRTVCGELVLVSFYETEKTSLLKGVKKMVVEKSSAVLDYPHEHSGPLYADHHTICKFESQSSVNYIDVRGMLQLMVSRMPSRNRVREDRRPSILQALKELEHILGISTAPKEDYNIVRASISDGSCQWILRKDSFRDWVDSCNNAPRTFWLTGPPATGKSTLAAFMIDWLGKISLEGSCQRFFFQSSNQMKRSTAFALRMLAFQVAQSHYKVREALLQLYEETNLLFEHQSVGSIWEKIFEGIIFRTSLSGTFYWVLDAMDEAEDGVTLMNMFCRVRSLTEIKIFITSRETKEFSAFVKNQSDRVTQERLLISDTSSDIEAYVSRAIQRNIPKSMAVQSEITHQILLRASGSFLWVKLTLDSMLEGWHTQEDIRRALMDIPSGMEHLYKRMLDMVKNQNDRSREIAQKILTWAVCSFRPLQLTELQVALLPDFEEFVSLQDTIDQVCGHFVTVQSNQIALVHATARDFLFHHSDKFINKSESHERLALACIKCLTDETWKNVLSSISQAPAHIHRNKRTVLDELASSHPFMRYAVEYWAYHVTNSNCNSGDLWEALGDFFEQSVLTWIHAAALANDLAILIRTAQYLRAFVHRKMKVKSDITQSPRAFVFQDVQWLRSWTVDLIRVVGRFGAALLQNPISIYRLIPVLCPRKSQIGSILPYSLGESTISVSGLASKNWDDCLARVSSDEDSNISRIVANETTFITLSSSNGKGTVWSAKTFEKLRHVDHQEYVTHIAVNKLGTSLAMASLKTLRIWEILSGRQLYSLPINSEARTMLLAYGDSESSIIIGRDDYSLQCYNVELEKVAWTFWALGKEDVSRNCPRLMVLSPDKTRVAVAERGRPVLIWAIDQNEDQRPWRCVRFKDTTRHLDDQEAWNAPEVACWHPESTSLFILYQDSTIVQWNFIFDEHKEYEHTGAREMVISKDGAFLLTSESSGNLSVWSTTRFNPIYRLFYGEFVRDLAFSPDSQRIYDCRGPKCNIWEPDVLIRHENVSRDDTSSAYEESTISDPVISTDESSRSPITALECDQNDEFFCCGRDDGTVAIHDAKDGKKLRKVYGHSSVVSVIALAWSNSGKYMISGDDSGPVICKRLEYKGTQKWAVFPTFETRLRNTIRQFLFHPDEHLVLISTESIDVLWDIRPKKKAEIWRRVWPHYTGRRWITHPHDSSKLLWLDPRETKIFDWETLTQTYPEIPPGNESPIGSKSRPQLTTTPSGTPECIRWLGSTRNNRCIISELLPDTGNARSLSARGLKVQLLHIHARGSTSRPSGILARQSLDDLNALIARIIRVVHGRVVFLNRSTWICTWEVGTPVATHKKHFFLPQDWIDPWSLELFICNQQGTFFYPRNGEVAIVRNGIRR